MGNLLETPSARIRSFILGSIRPPAAQALLIQFISLVVVFAVSVAVEARFAIGVPVFVGALAQGGLAALLSRWAGLAFWWWLIQLVFPVLFIAVSMLHLPSTMYLVAFVVLLLLFWTTFRTQVPFFPSGPAVRDTVASLLPEARAVRFIDIGSGVGDLAMALAERRPDADFAGIELAPLPWLISRVRARLRRNRARFIHGDYTTLDLGDYDVVFAFLSPAAMPALWAQAKRQMHSGAILLSYEFAIVDVTPSVVVGPDDRGASLYGWHM